MLLCAGVLSSFEDLQSVKRGHEFCCAMRAAFENFFVMCVSCVSLFVSFLFCVSFFCVSCVVVKKSNG